MTELTKLKLGLALKSCIGTSIDKRSSERRGLKLDRDTAVSGISLVAAVKLKMSPTGRIMRRLRNGRLDRWT